MQKVYFVIIHYLVFMINFTYIGKVEDYEKIFSNRKNIIWFWRLVMLNVINVINLFEHTNKLVKYSILITGIVCCIASNFFKEPKSCTNK